jgi:hypothetical protein
VAMFFGISVTFASGFVAYAVGAVALWLIVRRLVASGQKPAPSEAAEEDDGELVTVPANGNGNATEAEAEPESEPVEIID